MALLLLPFFLSFVLSAYLYWLRQPTRVVLAKPTRDLPTKKYVFILSYKEPVNLVDRVLDAASKIKDTPEIYLLDDGARDEIAQLAAKYQVRYVRRQENIHGKAGSINNGLRHLGDDGYLLLLNADEICGENIFHNVQAYFLDPTVIAVQCALDYFNTGGPEQLWQRSQTYDPNIFDDQKLFNQLIQARLKEPVCCGTSTVLDVAQLKRIGGFPSSSLVNEDLAFTALAASHSKRIVFHPQVESLSLATQTFHQFIVQRKKWSEGILRTLVTNNPLSRTPLPMRIWLLLFDRWVLSLVNLPLFFFIVFCAFSGYVPKSYPFLALLLYLTQELAHKVQSSFRFSILKSLALRFMQWGPQVAGLLACFRKPKISVTPKSLNI